MNKISFSKESILLMSYGLYAVICHATAILFMVKVSDITSPTVLFHRFFPMLEHSLMSFVIIMFGVLAIEYLHKISE